MNRKSCPSGMLPVALRREVRVRSWVRVRVRAWVRVRVRIRVRDRDRVRVRVSYNNHRRGGS